MLTYSGSQTRQAPPSQTVQCALRACARDVRVCDRIPASWQTIWLPWVQGISNKPFNGEFETQRSPLRSIYSKYKCFKASWIIPTIIFIHFHNHFPGTNMSLASTTKRTSMTFLFDALRPHFPGSLSTLSVEFPGWTWRNGCFGCQSFHGGIWDLISFILH